MSDYIPALTVFPIYYDIDLKGRRSKLGLGWVPLGQEECGRDSFKNCRAAAIAPSSYQIAHPPVQEGENLRRKWKLLPIIFRREIRIRIEDCNQNP
jgi:hypothetical protein